MIMIQLIAALFRISKSDNPISNGARFFASDILLSSWEQADDYCKGFGASTLATTDLTNNMNEAKDLCTLQHLALGAQTSIPTCWVGFRSKQLTIDTAEYQFTDGEAFNIPDNQFLTGFENPPILEGNGCGFIMDDNGGLFTAGVCSLEDWGLEFVGLCKTINGNVPGCHDTAAYCEKLSETNWACKNENIADICAASCGLCDPNTPFKYCDENAAFNAQNPGWTMTPSEGSIFGGTKLLIESDCITNTNNFNAYCIFGADKIKATPIDKNRYMCITPRRRIKQINGEEIEVKFQLGNRIFDHSNIFKYQRTLFCFDENKRNDDFELKLTNNAFELFGGTNQQIATNNQPFPNNYDIFAVAFNPEKEYSAFQYIGNSNNIQLSKLTRALDRSGNDNSVYGAEEMTQISYWMIESNQNDYSVYGGDKRIVNDVWVELQVEADNIRQKAADKVLVEIQNNNIGSNDITNNKGDALFQCNLGCLLKNGINYIDENGNWVNGILGKLDNAKIIELGKSNMEYAGLSECQKDMFDNNFDIGIQVSSNYQQLCDIGCKAELNNQNLQIRIDLNSGCDNNEPILPDMTHIADISTSSTYPICLKESGDYCSNFISGVAKGGYQSADPHYWTLDGRKHHFQGAGIYDLFISELPGFIVGQNNGPQYLRIQQYNTRGGFHPTYGDVSWCIGFAVQVCRNKQSTLGCTKISCEYNGLSYNGLQCYEDDNPADYGVQKTYQNVQYTINLINGGAMVEYDSTTGLKIFIQKDLLRIEPACRWGDGGDRSRGLMGSMDGNPQNDYVDKNGNVHCEQITDDGCNIPAGFNIKMETIGETWKTPTNEILFRNPTRFNQRRRNIRRRLVTINEGFDLALFPNDLVNDAIGICGNVTNCLIDYLILSEINVPEIDVEAFARKVKEDTEAIEAEIAAFVDPEPTIAQCYPQCKNGGKCISDGVCECIAPYYGDRCELEPTIIDYIGYNQKGSWNEAKIFCEETGSKVAIITNDELNQKFYDTCYKVADNSGHGCWIGLIRDNNDNFVWYDNTDSDYTVWATDEPNNLGGNEDCSHMWVKNTNDDWEKKWNDWRCTGSLPIVCNVYDTLE